MLIYSSKSLEVFDSSGHHRRSITSGNNSGANLLYPYRVAFASKNKEAFVLGMRNIVCKFDYKRKILYCADKWKNCVMLMDPASGIFETSFAGKGEEIGNGTKLSCKVRVITYS